MPSLPAFFSRWLDKLSRLLRVDTSYLLKGTVWGTAGQIVSAGAAFVLSILFAHYVSKETVGIYRYLLSVANLLTAFSLSGLNTSIIQSVARGYDDAFRSSLKESLLWSTPTVLIGIGVGIYYALHGNQAFAIGIPLTCLLVSIWNALLLIRSFLTGKQALRELFFTNALISVVPIIFLVYGFSVTQDPLGLLTIFLTTSCLITAIVYRIASQRLLRNHADDPAHHTYSRHLSLLYILDTFASQLDKVLVFQFIGSAQLATYTYATAFPEQIRALVKNVQTALLPKFSVRPTQQILGELNRKILLSTLALSVIAIVYILLAKYLFLIFFPRYQEAIFLSQIFALILVFENGLAGVVFKAKRAIKEQYLSNIVGNVLKIILMIVLLHFYGLIGLIVARVLSRAASFFTSFILTKGLATPASEA